jgi:hypothetical protein
MKGVVSPRIGLDLVVALLVILIFDELRPLNDAASLTQRGRQSPQPRRVVSAVFARLHMWVRATCGACAHFFASLCCRSSSLH